MSVHSLDRGRKPHDTATAEQDPQKEERPEALHTEKLADSTLAGGQVGKGRVPYAVAGEAMREAYARANKEKLTARANREKLTAGDYRVLGACLALTVGYSKLADRVYRAKIAELANISERSTGASLKKLHGLGIISWQPSHERGRPSTLALAVPRLGGEQPSPQMRPKGDANGAFGRTLRGTPSFPVPRSSTEKNRETKTVAGEEEPSGEEPYASGLNPNGVCSHGSCRDSERCLYE